MVSGKITLNNNSNCMHCLTQHHQYIALVQFDAQGVNVSRNKCTHYKTVQSSDSTHGTPAKNSIPTGYRQTPGLNSAIIIYRPWQADNTNYL